MTSTITSLPLENEMNRVKRWYLRRKARNLYIQYQQEIDGYSCGVTLAEHINPSLVDKRLKVEAIVAQLKSGERMK